jgi:hypothetical protein
LGRLDRLDSDRLGKLDRLDSDRLGKLGSDRLGNGKR